MVRYAKNEAETGKQVAIVQLNYIPWEGYFDQASNSENMGLPAEEIANCGLPIAQNVIPQDGLPKLRDGIDSVYETQEQDVDKAGWPGVQNT